MLIRLDKVSGAEHIESVVVPENGVKNGSIVAIGEYAGFDNVNVTKPANITTEELVMIVEEFIDKVGNHEETNMTFKKDEIVRAYNFVAHDIITVTDDGITGATVVGEYVIPANGSYDLSASSTKEGTLAFKVIAKEIMDGKASTVLKVIR